MADDHRRFIAGEWVGSESGTTFAATSPSTGEVIGTLAEGTCGGVRGGSRLPFGGWAGSASGVGRVGGRFSIERLTELKTIVVHLG